VLAAFAYSVVVFLGFGKGLKEIREFSAHHPSLSCRPDDSCSVCVDSQQPVMQRQRVDLSME
jgi:hypothetical protein